MEDASCRELSGIDPDQYNILSLGNHKWLYSDPVSLQFRDEIFSVNLLCRSAPVGQGFLLLGTFNHTSHFPVGTNPHQLI